jgi:hypothetical protein
MRYKKTLFQQYGPNNQPIGAGNLGIDSQLNTKHNVKSKLVNYIIKTIKSFWGREGWGLLME